MYIATEPCFALAVVIYVSALQVQGFSLVPPPQSELCWRLYFVPSLPRNPSGTPARWQGVGCAESTTE